MGKTLGPIGKAAALALAAALSACSSGADRRDVADTPQVRPPSQQAALSSPAPPQPRMVAARQGFLQCVPYARSLSGIQIRGDAHTWWRGANGRYARGHRPRAGAVIVLKTGAARGHVATVTRVLDNRTIVTEHANWLNRGRIHVETPIRDVSAAGDCQWQ